MSSVSGVSGARPVNSVRPSFTSARKNEKQKSKSILPPSPSEAKKLADSRGDSFILPTYNPNVVELVDPKSKLKRPAFPVLEKEKTSLYSELFHYPDMLRQQSKFLEQSSELRQNAPHLADFPKDEQGRTVMNLKAPYFYIFDRYRSVPEDAGNFLKDLLKIMHHSGTNPEFRPIISKLMKTMTKAASQTVMPDGKVNGFAMGCFRNMINIGKHITAFSRTVQAGNFQSYDEAHGYKLHQELTDYCNKIDELLDKTQVALVQQEKEKPEKDALLVKAKL